MDSASGSASASASASAAAPASQRSPALSRDPADLLTFGFGTTVAMWVAGYVCRVPLGTDDGAPAVLPGSALFSILIVILLGSGWLARDRLAGGWQRLLKAGLLTGGLNLLIVGGVISRDAPSELMKAAALWGPGSVLFCAGLMLAGWWLAAAWQRRTAGESESSTRSFDSASQRVAVPESASRRLVVPGADWSFRFVMVAVCATLALLAVGGAVTGMQAGLAVTDWPNSFGYNMFLYPVARMTGGIYFEHSHRLFGSLVGLTTLVLAIYLQRFEPRGWVRTLGWAAFVMVCVQGVMGGLRVTGKLTLSQSAAEVAPDLRLAVAHGVLAQVFLSTLVAIAVFVSRTWRVAGAFQVMPSATPVGQRPRRIDVLVALGLVATMLVQIVIGAVFRHYALGLYLHLGIAALVAALAGAVGIRAWMLPDRLPALPKLGERLVLVMMAQVLLGLLALLGINLTARAGRPVPLDVLFTTLHQTTGAVMLALSVATTFWVWRLRTPAPAGGGARPPTKPVMAAGAPPFMVGD